MVGVIFCILREGKDIVIYIFGGFYFLEGEEFDYDKE